VVAGKPRDVTTRNIPLPGTASSKKLIVVTRMTCVDAIVGNKCFGKFLVSTEVCFNHRISIPAYAVNDDDS
jgi:hypothetical protein